MNEEDISTLRGCWPFTSDLTECERIMITVPCGCNSSARSLLSQQGCDLPVTPQSWNRQSRPAWFVFVGVAGPGRIVHSLLVTCLLAWPLHFSPSLCCFLLCTCFALFCSGLWVLGCQLQTLLCAECCGFSPRPCLVCPQTQRCFYFTFSSVDLFRVLLFGLFIA